MDEKITYFLDSEAEMVRLEALHHKLFYDSLKKGELNHKVNWDDAILLIFLDHSPITLTEIAKKHIKVYSQLRNKQIAQLNEKLIELTSKHNEDQSTDVKNSLLLVLKELEALSQVYFSQYRKFVKGAKKYLIKKRSINIRQLIRNIIQFHFKNLDDETFSDFLNFIRNGLNFFTLKGMNYEIQRESNHRYQQYYLF